MRKTTSRRGFLEVSGAAGSCLMFCPLCRGGEAEGDVTEAPTLPDFEKVTYCCFECKPEQCPTLKASLDDDKAFKRKKLAEWREKHGDKVAEWERKKGRAMTAEDVFCFGCQVEGDRQGPLLGQCTARACVIERKLISCAHCADLETCQKDLWVNYPDFRKHVLGIRRALLASPRG